MILHNKMVFFLTKNKNDFVISGYPVRISRSGSFLGLGQSICCGIRITLNKNKTERVCQINSVTPFYIEKYFSYILAIKNSFPSKFQIYTPLNFLRNPLT